MIPYAAVHNARFPAPHALAEAVEELARERHCTAIHTNLIRTRDTVPANGGLVEVLCTRGHRIETIGMCKPLPP